MIHIQWSPSIKTLVFKDFPSGKTVHFWKYRWCKCITLDLPPKTTPPYRPFFAATMVVIIEEEYCNINQGRADQTFCLRLYLVLREPVGSVVYLYAVRRTETHHHMVKVDSYCARASVVYPEVPVMPILSAEESGYAWSALTLDWQHQCENTVAGNWASLICMAKRSYIYIVIATVPIHITMSSPLKWGLGHISIPVKVLGGP